MASDRTDRRRHRLSAETLRQLDELQVEISPNKSTVVTAELLNYIEGRSLARRATARYLTAAGGLDEPCAGSRPSSDDCCVACVAAPDGHFRASAVGRRKDTGRRLLAWAAVGGLTNERRKLILSSRG